MKQFYDSEHCRGVIICGNAGVGKSKLALHVQGFVDASGYFLCAKFDQTQNSRPLATVGSLFNSLCDMFDRDATQNQKQKIGESLQYALGAQAANLLGISSSIMKLMPSVEISSNNASWIDSTWSVGYLFNELLRVIASQCSRIVFFVDDLQCKEYTMFLSARFHS